MLSQFNKVEQSGRTFPKITRMKDRSERYPHVKNDPKRVYLLEIEEGPNGEYEGENYVVQTTYDENTEETRERFANNIRFYEFCKAKEILVPEIVYVNEPKLFFVVKYFGPDLPEYLVYENCSDQAARSVVSAASSAILYLNIAEQKKCRFELPVRLQMLKQAFSSGMFSALPLETQGNIGKVLDKIHEYAQEMEQKECWYGYGKETCDFSDFLVGPGWTVAMIDFDDAGETVDPYYSLGYFYVTLERTARKKMLQAFFMDQMGDRMTSRESKIRFRLGMIAALSNQLRISCNNEERVQARLVEIEAELRAIEK